MKGRAKLAIAVAGVAVGASIPAICFAVAFEGLTFEATCALGILVAAIIWWIGSVLPEYVTGLIMACAFIVVAGVPTDVVFSTFSSSTWWLLLAAFGLGLGMQKSGLMRRMALAIVHLFPRTFKAQAAGLMAAGTLVGPFIPSLSAKASMLAPLSMGVSDSMGYERQGRQASGLFLAMFTGLRNVGPVVISASVIGYGLLALLPEDVQMQFDMVHWALCMLPWFIVVTVLNYVAIIVLYGPKGGRPIEKGASRSRSASDGMPDAPASPAAPSDAPVSSLAANPHVQAASAAAPASRETGDAAKDADLGSMSLHEKEMAVIMVACVALWVLEPVLGIGSHVVGLMALAATIACGVFGGKEFRSGISWDSLVFIGTVLGLAEVFEYLGIDTWIVGACEPVFGMLAANPYLFIAGIGIVTVAMRFVIVSEMAYINIFMAFMVPLALELGINPWVVGVAVYATVNPWFALYQNPIYLTAYYAVDGQMVKHSDMARYCVLYVVICLAGLMASVPYWQWLGLL